MTASSCHQRPQPGPITWARLDDGFEQAVQFIPGYNCPEPGGRGHGVHGMKIRWYLRGPNGAAQFLLFSNWIPGELRPGHGLPPSGSPVSEHVDSLLRFPMGADVGYHARVRQYDDQELMSGTCHVIDGPCYYDGSGLAGYELGKRFIVDGEPAIWQALRDWYGRIEMPGDLAPASTIGGYSG